MKRTRKGFTLVELVIVIAVIAILAAVLIPTFSNVIADSRQSAAISEVRDAVTLYLSNNAGKDDIDLLNSADGYLIVYEVSDDNFRYYQLKNGETLELTFSEDSGVFDTANLQLNVALINPNEVLGEGVTTYTPVLNNSDTFEVGFSLRGGTDTTMMCYKVE